MQRFGAFLAKGISFDLQGDALNPNLFLEFYARDDAAGTVGQFTVEVSSDEADQDTL